MRAAYAASQTAVMHMKRLNQTRVSDRFSCFLCVLFPFLLLFYYFCICMSLHVCPGEILILDSRLANFGERNCPFGFLLVVF